MAEWLLDNTHLVQGAVDAVREGIPGAFYRKLPRVEGGSPGGAGGEGAPGADDELRILLLAGEFLEEQDHAFDPELAEEFVAGRQEEEPLTMGELWALSSAFRLVALEELERLVVPLVEEEPQPPRRDTRGDGEGAPDAGGESAAGGSATAAATAAASLATRKVPVCIETLRRLSEVDWTLFFRRTSLVERKLREDPAGCFARMDDASRDRYRKAVEELAVTGSASSEVRVAETAVRLAATARAAGRPVRARGAGGSGPARDGDGRNAVFPEPEEHVGFYLVDEGRGRLEQRTGTRLGAEARFRRWIVGHGPTLYLGSVALGTTVAVGVLLTWIAAAGGGPALLVGAGALAVVPSVTLAVAAVHWAVTHLLPPRALPKLELDRSDEPSVPTAVVVPCMLTSTAEVRDLLDRLEVLYQGSAVRGLRFALLSDFADADEPEMPGDRALLDAARAGVERLNRRHGGHGDTASGPFHLLHRERRWNPSEGRWMGWERKRGKLHEFNRLVRGAGDTSYVVEIGETGALREVRFVVTLDADTRLPPGAASRLIGTLAHPLNRPRFGPDDDVIRGYTVLQPRLQTTPGAGRRTLFTRIFEGEAGLDLYSHAVSDAYQDLFGEGIYVGKGIYDLDAFERAMAGRVPENALLSHDLFEGICGRAALVSDITLFEEYPSHPVEYMRRFHRWIRGDWQLLPWLLGGSSGVGGRDPGGFSAMDRWKMTDNLRRSLLAPSLVSLVALGWLSGVGSAWIWIAWVAGVVAFPTFLGAATAATRRLGRSRPWGRREATRRRPLSVARRLGRESSVQIARWLLWLVLLPYEAWVAGDAIVRTLYRLAVSRRHLLEWATAAHVARRLARGRRGLAVWREMAAGPAASVVLGAACWSLQPGVFPATLSLTVPWLVSPALAELLGRPRRLRRRALSAEDVAFLRRSALRTWLFFERFMDSEHHWLPPDNSREAGDGGPAERTSPTNIGLGLTAVLAAYDVGFIDALALEATLHNALESMRTLERHRGHFLNWYSTRDLSTLPPRYVSTVDSGNLAACLLTVSRGLEDVRSEAPVRTMQADGLVDALSVLREEVESCLGSRADREYLDPILDAMDEARGAAERGRESPAQLVDELLRLAEEVLPRLEERLVSALEWCGDELAPDHLRRVRIWSRRATQHVDRLFRVVRTLLPWRPELETVPALYRRAGPEGDGEPAGRPRDPALRVVRERWHRLRSRLREIPPLRTIPGFVSTSRESLDALEAAVEELEETGRFDAEVEEARAWNREVGELLEAGGAGARRLLEDLARVGDTAADLADAMDFAFLYDGRRDLFHLGYDVDTGDLDPHHYDLLASEARLASLLAMAKDDAPVRHWLHLGRPFRSHRGSPVLLSWSGTMFEYLLPAHFARTPPGSLLERSCRAAVEIQMRYGREKGAPWGLSESGYAETDGGAEYGYRAFGVPSLRLKREQEERVVVAPYASFLALPFDPPAAVKNLRRLAERGMLGTYGFREALDLGAGGNGRPGRGDGGRVVRSYMAHHQGMALVSVANTLRDDVMVRRFHRDPRIRSVEHVLSEAAPWAVSAGRAWVDRARPAVSIETPPTVRGWTVPSGARAPAAQLLSNGAYRTWITAAGAGDSAWRDLAVTRGVRDPTLEEGGQWIYVHDLERDELWSATPAPAGASPESGVQLFSPHAVEFHRRDHGVAVETRICVHPDDDVELRHVAVSNLEGRPRRLALCSYGEVVLAPPAEDHRHPAFSKLFVEAEFLPERGILLYRRRPRSPVEASPWAGHALLTGRWPPTVRRWATDRGRFLGRNGSVRQPRFFDSDAGRRLSPDSRGNGVHAPLDPVFALETAVPLGGYESRELAWLTAAGEDRDQVLALLDRYRLGRVRDAFEQAREAAVRRLQRRGITAHDARLSQRLLSALHFPRPEARAPEQAFRKSELPRSALWRHGVSGDLPVLLARLGDPEDVGLASRLFRIHAFWKRQGLAVDLVLLDDHSTGYQQPLRDRLRAALRRESDPAWLGEDGGVHLLSASGMAEEEIWLFETTAAVLLEPGRGEPDAQLALLEEEPDRMPAFVRVPSSPPGTEPTPALDLSAGLEFDNGLGGFAADTGEYVIRRLPGEPTPAPWCNVLANPDFGCLVSESSLGSTWAGDSGEFRLTPWRNDPVSDPPAEVVYLRDEETAEVWSATPSPCGSDVPWEIRHSTGSTTFHHRRAGLDQRLTLFVAHDAPVKVAELQLRNLWERQRRLTVTYYAEWVLGTHRIRSLAHVVPGYDAGTPALLAQNPRSPRFPGRVAFLTSDLRPHGLTADRAEFLGRGGSLERPEGLERIGLSGAVRPGGDPCAAYQVHVDLGPGGATTVRFVLGSGADRDEALELARRFRAASVAEEARSELEDQWDARLGALTVHTPDRALDLLVNRWLPYQTLSSRLWARTAFYQSSGAFGFRDQLQDVLAFLLTDPDLARRQILRAAARQFAEGDVLHWWHPGTTRGVRTRCSDDLLWLPFATAEYLEATGDTSVLDARVPFLVGPRLAPDEEERYEEFGVSQDRASLYRHCQAALDRGTTAGRHGLPLMGTGDWNDGMDRVGVGGEGESVWLGWFLHTVLERFAPWCRERGDADRALELEERARSLGVALEEAWDGQWYHRAYYDDGTPLGSAASREARIDTISQAWAVLSGVASPERARTAMESVWQELVRPDDGLVLLLAPPFDRTRREPGYIKGYPPGVRENGGQYSHAAAWVGWAYAELGDTERAYRVLRMLNPVHRTRKRGEVERYRVEPYVQAADVYGVPPHVGRGGWTWYTGSAAWTRRLAVEAILGLRRQGNRLVIRPVLPPGWPGYEAELTLDGTRYRIEVVVAPEAGREPDELSGEGAPQLFVDGEPVPDGTVALEPGVGTRVVRLRIPASGGGGESS